MKSIALCSLFLAACMLFVNPGCQLDTSQQSKLDLTTYPAWVKDAVFYQIFPERFHNGDTSNDPQIEDLRGSWPHDPVKQWSVHPWTSDWYKLQPWEEKNGKGFYYNAQLRRYGGDIQGVIDKLDYLVDLGINAIYFNPVFESPSLHKYDAAFYHHIEDNFGPDPQKDRRIIATEEPNNPETWKWTTADSLFLHLLDMAHQKGVRIIIDGVFNHVGLRFWAFEDVKKHKENSKYLNWFTIKQWDDPATPEDEFDYECWFGAKTLPELREDSTGIVTGPKEHIFAIVKRWMDPNGDGDPSDGIDGWRLDVAEKVNPAFWKDFRKYVKDINPQAYITAELFWENWDEKKLMDPTPWLQGDQFDGVMNYRWGAAVLDFVTKNKKRKPTSSQFVHQIDTLLQSLPDTLNYILQNLMDSHDTERMATHIKNPNIYLDTYVTPHNEKYDISKPSVRDKRFHKMLAFMQMTALGAPMIYYGTEAGMWGADDPDDRKPMVWPEYTFETETHHPLGKERSEDTVEFDRDLFNYYRSVIQLRKAHPALSRGSWKAVHADDENEWLAVLRSYRNKHYLLLYNHSVNGRQISFKLPDVLTDGRYVELLTGRAVDTHEGQLHALVAAKSGAIYEPKGQQN